MPVFFNIVILLISEKVKGNKHNYDYLQDTELDSVHACEFVYKSKLNENKVLVNTLWNTTNIKLESSMQK